MLDRILLQMYEYCTYFLAPPFCLYCSVPINQRQAFCQNCSLHILPVVPYDLYCGKDKLVRIFAFSAYKDPLRSLILSKHTSNQTNMYMVTRFVVEQSTIFDCLDFDYIVYIPLHWTRYARRGFNQSEILAQAIANKSGKPVIPLLKRCKMTQFQARLSIEQRQNNVQDAFELSEKYIHCIAGKKILLVDDLFTTGSTIKSAALLLWKYKPSQIDVFVMCRVVSS